MRARVPSLATPPEVKKREDERITQERRYKLITPLFGGGVEPNQADPITVVRGTEIRGQLRFWWRATRGGQFNGDLDKMRQAEAAIWGAAAGNGGPSKVNVYVYDVVEGKLDRPFEVTRNRYGRPSIRPRKDSVVPAYAAFPLQPEKKEARIGMETAAVRVGVEFILEVSYPQDNAIQQEIEAALWAWETFGGLGARTRRGFGALQLLSVNDDGVPVTPSGKFKAALRKKLQHLVVNGKWPDDVPHLGHDMRIEVYRPSHHISPIQVWSHLIGKLQDFRQKRHKHMGLSLWPEANEIRYRLNRSLKWPKRNKSPKLVHKFPRAVFGLPILFHLPHDKNLYTNSFTLRGKPDSKTGKTFERLASPLLLKPIVCADGHAVGLVAVLKAPFVPPHGLEIEGFPTNKRDVEWQVTNNESNTDPLEEMLLGQTDVLQAFLTFLKK
ncbi:MAG: type III-B CRISPR module RAMP protein Cmr1 [Chloroflexota bacterium]|nr:type III-B CRISPR module RAMP protein Cmr1 [Chloroflexota bacterium]